MTTALELDPGEVRSTLQPVERATMLPPAAFVDPARARLGAGATSSRGWICAGHVSAVAEPGDFIIREVGARQRPRHRRRGRRGRAPSSTSAATAAPASSTRPRAACAGGSTAPTTPGPMTSTAPCAPLPTWTGSRTSTPPASACSRCASPSSAASCWSTSAARRPPRSTSASCSGHLERYSVEGLRRGGGSTTRSKANWKGIAENYNECLHCPGVHPELNALSDYMSGEEVYGAGAWCGGSMTLARAPRRWAPAAATPATARRSRASTAADLRHDPLLRALPQRARLAPPRLRDAPHPLAARAGPDRRHLRVVLRAGDDRARRTSTPATRSTSGTQVNREDWHVCELAQKGVRPARLHRRPLLGRGNRRPRLRHDGRRPLHGGAAGRGGEVRRERRIADAARRGRACPSRSPSSPRATGTRSSSAAATTG